MEVTIVEIKGAEDAAAQIAGVGAHPYAVLSMAPKAAVFAVKLSGIDNRAANLVKQDALGVGADAAISADVSCFKKGVSDLLIFANLKQYNILAEKFSVQPFGLGAVGRKIETALTNYQKKTFKIKCGSRTLWLGERPLVMGILNVSPDSFSKDGLFECPEGALERALAMEADGAKIIDIGGESSRPGSSKVTSKEEKQRVLPVLKKVVKKVKVPISIDTRKSDVARAALENGATIINDISGLRNDNGLMARVVARYRVPVIIMHMLGMPRTMQKNPVYDEVVGDIGGFFSGRIKFALDSGIKPEQILLDPGIGFGKTVEHNIEILKRLKEFKIFGCPLVVGTSRKSFIGKLLNQDDPRDRKEGSLATFVWAALNGANILRVHDVKATVNALKIVEALS